ncbi:polyprenyl synthetase family protein [Candidatus Harpocratesius sp.]
MSYQELQEDINQNIKSINEYIVNNIKIENETLFQACIHLFNAGGKRIRPYIMRTVYSLFKTDSSPITPIASAIEILHTFTLIHDDIMDQDKFRRGFPTVHTKWGQNIAILAGDVLHSLVFSIISQSDFNKEILTRIMIDFSETLIKICEGQTMDLQFEKQENVTINEYLKMISLKTGELLALSARTGGIAAEVDENMIKNLSNFGLAYGFAFQIIDDILGIIGDQGKLGKPIGSDLRQGKKTFVILYALENTSDDEQKILKDILRTQNLSEGELKKGIEIISNSGAIDNARILANKYLDSALDNLEKLPSSNGKNNLIQLTKKSLNRKF